jgi:hypothetical protein
MARWSDVIDAARYTSVEQAIFGDEPALRIARALTTAPSPDWPDVWSARWSTATSTRSRTDRRREGAPARRAQPRQGAGAVPADRAVEEGRRAALRRQLEPDPPRAVRAFYHHPDISYSSA